MTCHTGNGSQPLRARPARPRHYVPEAEWMKSRWSNPSGECVELATLPDGIVAIRNSRYPDRLWLYFTQEDIAAFIHGAKSGDFDTLLSESPSIAPTIPETDVQG